MKPAKIVHLTSVHPPFEVRLFHKECRSLAQAGYNVTVVAPHNRDDVRDGVRIKAVPEPKGRLSRMTLTVWRVYREAVRQRADVYHFHDPELIPVGLLLRAQGKKVLYDIREDLPRTIPVKYYVPSWLAPPLARAAECVENLACRWFSALVPTTPPIGQRFQPLNHNIVVVHNYPLLQEFQSQAKIPWSQRTCSVAYTGACLSVGRSLREMVQAVGLLPDTLPATLKLTGSFVPASLREEVARLPGWKRVEYLGILDRAEIAAVLGSVQAGLVVEKPEPNHLQSRPIKMFEYMSAGIPVVASDFPLWRKIIGNAGCGLIVDPLSPRAISQAIEYVLTHSEEAQAMGCRGRQAVEHQYNWKNEERKLLELYAGLLQTTRGGPPILPPSGPI